MPASKYSTQQVNEFLELAQEVGITRAMRELGYPNAWGTAQGWAKNRGVSLAVDEIKSQAAATREWYKDEEVMTVAQLGMSRVYEELTRNTSLTADEQRKLASALKTHYEVWANVQGKATAINENRVSDAVDEHLQELMSLQQAKNALKDKEDEPTSIFAND